MTPAIGGVIAAQYAGDPVEIAVHGAILSSTTTLHVKQSFGGGSVEARIELSEMDRIELIELLGGTA